MIPISVRTKQIQPDDRFFSPRKIEMIPEIDDPFQRRRAIVLLHAEGWNAKSIAGYLDVSRQTVHTVLKRWAEEQFAGLHDKSSAPHHPAQKPP